jgi:WD40 repeat protein
MGATDVAIRKDNTLAYVSCLDGVYGIELPALASSDTKAIPYLLGKHDSYVSSVALVQQETRLLTSGYDGAIQARNINASDKTVVAPALNLKLHNFWSWQMASSPDERWLASVTGQYLAGSEDYTPAASADATVILVEQSTGNIKHQLHLLPSVQCVAFDPTSRYVAAANLLGDIAVWEIESGKEIAKWRSPNFTSWGIIKSHCYIGGIFALAFSPDSESLYCAGMGDMRDPMAGNGKQLWQRFAWKEQPPRKLQESHTDDTGEGLMETLTFHPQGKYFVMAGRLRGGNWNLGIFESESGRLIGQAKTGMRITTARFSADGKLLYLAGMQGQPGIKEGRFPDFGYLERFEVLES